MNVVPIVTDCEALDAWTSFWILYPRHVAKKDALKAWARIDAAAHVEILTSLTAWRRVWLERGELQFVPYPATWLNGERWQDELPKDFRVQAHVPFASTAQTKKAEMPEHVKAMIAKLRGK